LVRILLVFILLAVGLSLGVAVDSWSQPDCPVVSLWVRAKAACVAPGQCDREAVSAFLRASGDCESQRVRTALPAVRVLGATLLAKNAPAPEAFWDSAANTCAAAGGRDCSRLELERMVPGAKDDHADR
jgi:hypothetical protein